MRVLYIFILALFFSSFTFAQEPQVLSPKKIKYVIYITLDGVRWQDFFLYRQYFNIFWNKYANQVNIYGKPGDHNSMTVASVPVSLPSYQSQMTGRVEACRDNNCGRVTIETLPEKLKKELSLQKKDVAIFASWFEIEYAAQHLEGSVFTNTANTPVFDPDTQIADSVMEDLNLQQSADHYPDDDITRFDKYTIAQAMHYFETYLPRFLWISLDDADEAAHGNNRNAYISTLTLYDNFIDNLFTKLHDLDIDKETMVIVTTDHGRGIGPRWSDHGPGDPASNVTWAFVMNGELTPISSHNNITNYSTLSIRPTVESVLIA